jgi:hypothetical protein
VRLYVLENVEKIPLPPNDRRALQSWLNQIEPLTGTTTHHSFNAASD